MLLGQQHANAGRFTALPVRVCRSTSTHLAHKVVLYRAVVNATESPTYESRHVQNGTPLKWNALAWFTARKHRPIDHLRRLAACFPLDCS